MSWDVHMCTPYNFIIKFAVNVSIKEDVYSFSLLILQLIMKVEDVNIIRAKKRKQDMITCVREKLHTKRHAVHKYC